MIAARKDWLSVLARAPDNELLACLEQAIPLPAYSLLRGPETGLVMIQGRIGGNGAAFNLGEVTVTRCSIRDAAGRVGHGYAMGRELAHVERIARLDAVLQDDMLRDAYQHTVIEPLRLAQYARHQADAGKATATEVKFFTLEAMRG